MILSLYFSNQNTNPTIHAQQILYGFFDIIKTQMKEHRPIQYVKLSDPIFCTYDCALIQPALFRIFC